MTLVVADKLTSLPAIPIERKVARFTDELLLAYAKAQALAGERTEHTSEKCLLAVLPLTRKWSQTSRQGVCVRLDSHPKVMAELGRIRDEEFSRNLLGQHERRAILASVARTNLPDVANAEGELNSSLTPEQAAAVRKVRVVSGEHGTTREVELHDKLAAIRLDAELAGVLGRGNAVAVQVNNTVKVYRWQGEDENEKGGRPPPHPCGATGGSP